jgi:hypothetical protein
VRRTVLLSAVLLLMALPGAGDAARAQQDDPDVRWAATLTAADAQPATGSTARGVFHAWQADDTVRYRLLLRDLDRGTEATIQFKDSSEDVAFVFRPAETTTESVNQRPLELAESADDFDSFTSVDWGGRFTDDDFCGFQCGAQLFGSLRGDMAGFVAALDARMLRVVVRSKGYPGGEIAGDIVLVPAGTEPPALPSAGKTAGGGPADWVWAIAGTGAALVIVVALVALRTRRRWRVGGADESPPS